MTAPANTFVRIILLRLAALAVFPAGAILLGVFQSSLLALALLAAAMTVITLFSVRNLLAMGAPAGAIGLKALVTSFLVMLVLLIAVFVVTIGVLALFRDTSLAREVGIRDLAVIAGASLVAVMANRSSGKMVKTEFAAARSQFATVFGRPGGPASGSGEIIEGEVVESGPDPRDPPSRPLT